MHALYKLKDMLCAELEEYGERGELSAGSLATIDTLAHALKNLDKIIWVKEEEGGESYDSGSSGRGSYDGGSYRGGRGGSYRGSYDGGRSMARGYSSKRDSMGRYSRRGYSGDSKEDMIAKAEELMREATDKKTKDLIEVMIQKLEQG